MGQDRLCALALLSIEAESAQFMRTDKLIECFASAKVRRKTFCWREVNWKPACRTLTLAVCWIIWKLKPFMFGCVSWLLRLTLWLWVIIITDVLRYMIVYKIRTRRLQVTLLLD